jgi:hypothetical protein
MRLRACRKNPAMAGLLIGANGSGWLADAVFRRFAVFVRSQDHGMSRVLVPTLVPGPGTRHVAVHAVPSVVPLVVETPGFGCARQAFLTDPT